MTEPLVERVRLQRRNDMSPAVFLEWEQYLADHAAVEILPYHIGYGYDGYPVQVVNTDFWLGVFGAYASALAFCEAAGLPEGSSTQ